MIEGILPSSDRISLWRTEGAEGGCIRLLKKLAGNNDIHERFVKFKVVLVKICCSCEPSRITEYLLDKKNPFLFGSPETQGKKEQNITLLLRIFSFLLVLQNCFPFLRQEITVASNQHHLIIYTK